MNYKDKVQSTTILTKSYYTTNALFQQTTNKIIQIIMYKMTFVQNALQSIINITFQSY
jgi:hypothetical protein